MVHDGAVFEAWGSDASPVPAPGVAGENADIFFLLPFLEWSEMYQINIDDILVLLPSRFMSPRKLT